MTITYLPFTHSAFAVELCDIYDASPEGVVIVPPGTLLSPSIALKCFLPVPSSSVQRSDSFLSPSATVTPIEKLSLSGFPSPAMFHEQKSAFESFVKPNAVLILPSPNVLSASHTESYVPSFFISQNLPLFVSIAVFPEGISISGSAPLSFNVSE